MKINNFITQCPGFFSHVLELFPLISRIPIIFQLNIPKSPSRTSDMNIFKVETSQSTVNEALVHSHDPTSHSVGARSLGTSAKIDEVSKESLRPEAGFNYVMTSDPNHYPQLTIKCCLARLPGRFPPFRKPCMFLH